MFPTFDCGNCILSIEYKCMQVRHNIGYSQIGAWFALVKLRLDQHEKSVVESRTDV